MSLSYQMIAGILTLVIITAGTTYYITQNPGSPYKICTGGSWVLNESTGKYDCASRGISEYCFSISGTRCYLGTAQSSTINVQNVVEDIPTPSPSTPSAACNTTLPRPYQIIILKQTQVSGIIRVYYVAVSDIGCGKLLKPPQYVEVTPLQANSLSSMETIIKADVQSWLSSEIARIEALPVETVNLSYAFNSQLINGNLNVGGVALP